MIEIKNIEFGYEDETLFKDFDLNINTNEQVVIIGKSGSGKSTLLMLLGNILKVNKGSISIMGDDVQNFKKSSIVFQNGGLFPWKTVRKNLELALGHTAWNKEEKNTKIMSICTELGIEGLLDKYIKELSGGQAQRVAIARGLVNSSELLLLDEPSSSLDALTKEKFQDALLHIYKNHSITSVLITHDIEEAVYLGSKIIVLGDGKIIKQMENELYGIEDIRNSVTFYEKCIELRELLKL